MKKLILSFIAMGVFTLMPLVTQAACKEGATRFLPCPIGQYGFVTQTCDSSKQWGATVRTCEAIKCGTLSIGESVADNSECPENYTSTQTPNFTTTCTMPLTYTNVGNNSVTSTNCKPKYDTCSSRGTIRVLGCPIISKFTAQANLARIGSKVGSIVQRCNGTVYNTVKDTCPRVTCGDEPVGTYRTVQKRGCPQGRVGTLLEVCSPDGTWKISMANCPQVSCVYDASDLANNNVVWLNTVAGQTASTDNGSTCVPGFLNQTAGAITRKCNIKGKWDDPSGGCTISGCAAGIAGNISWPQTARNGTAQTNPPGQANCLTGYYNLTNTIISRTCDNSGNWGAPSGSCSLPLPCSAEIKDNVSWGSASGGTLATVTAPGDTGTHKCVAGYRAGTDITRQCKTDGTWETTTTGGTCSQLQCTGVTESNAIWATTGAGNTATITSPGTNTSDPSRCSNGYSTSSNITRLCQLSGVWGAPAGGSCSPVECSADISANAEWAATPNGATAIITQPGVAGTHKCSSGYMTANDISRVCSNGVWQTPTGGTCSNVICPADADAANKVNWGATANGATASTATNSSCFSGYVTINDLTRQCSGGVWQTPSGSCTAAPLCTGLFTGYIQTCIIPANGNYFVEAWGAEGAQGTGGSTAYYSAAQCTTMGTPGKGARMRGVFSFNAGDVLQLVVGEKPTQGNLNAGGGGGGSFVFLNNSVVPIIAAGGGGGGAWCSGSTNYATGGQITTSGMSAAGFSATAAGGTGGSGGGVSASAGLHGGGGAGSLANGGIGSYASAALTGTSTSGWAGGTPSGAASRGGYGGGAAGSGGGGGGGGYSGGGGGSYASTVVGAFNGSGGGGGGSYNSAVSTAQSNTANNKSGHGAVQIGLTNPCSAEADATSKVNWISTVGGTVASTSSGSTCFTDYTTGTAITRSCGIDGTWGIPSGSCILIQCPAQTAIAANGYVNWAATNVGSTASTASGSSCATNYETVTPITRDCQTGGNWGAPSGTCVIKSCAAQTENNRVWASIDVGTTATITAPGATGTHTCSGATRTATNITRACNNVSGTATWATPAGGSCVTPCAASTLNNVNWIATNPGATASTAAGSSCITDYQTGTAITRVCNASGVWQTPSGSCTQITCPAETENNRVWAATVATTAGTTATITPPGTSGTHRCSTNFGTVSTINRTCTNVAGVGTWGTPTGGSCTPSCVAEAGSAANGFVTWSVTAPGVTASTAPGTGGACITNYATATPVTRVCNADGTWGTLTGSCSPITCPAQTENNRVWAITNAGTTATITAPGATGTHTCNGATRTATNITRVCNNVSGTGTWAAASGGSCVVPCAASTANNVNWIATNPGATASTAAGSSCITDFRTGTPITRSCSAAGVWGTPSGSCTQITCPANTDSATNSVWASVNASTTATITAPGTSGTHRCSTNFGTASNITRTCNNVSSVGTWGTPSASCIASCAAETGNAANGYVNWGITAPGQTATTASGSSCITNFGTPTPITRLCQADGTWAAQSGSCQQITCPAQTENNRVWAITNAGTTATITAPGDTGTHTCNGATRTATNITRVCNSGSGTGPGTGTWATPAGGSCVTPCAASTVNNVDWVTTNPGTTASTANGGGTCASGYSTSTTITRACSAAGAWGTPSASCILIQCPAENDSAASATASNATWAAVVPGVTSTIGTTGNTCNSGGVATPAGFTRTCGAGGVWEVATGRCKVTSTYAYTGTIQTFTAPFTGSYTLTVSGAQGGFSKNSSGGNIPGANGIRLKETYTLSAGDVLKLVVGEQPPALTAVPSYGNGGGGATVVFKNGTLHMVAGGGGGAYGYAAFSASTLTSPRSATYQSSYSYTHPVVTGDPYSASKVAYNCYPQINTNSGTNPGAAGAVDTVWPLYGRPSSDPVRFIRDGGYSNAWGSGGGASVTTDGGVVRVATMVGDGVNTSSWNLSTIANTNGKTGTVSSGWAGGVATSLGGRGGYGGGGAGYSNAGGGGGGYAGGNGNTAVWLNGVDPINAANPSIGQIGYTCGGVGGTSFYAPSDLSETTTPLTGNSGNGSVLITY
jgi:hypothetical protein